MARGFDEYTAVVVELYRYTRLPFKFSKNWNSDS